ncbi:MAG: type II secretion system protein N, partial [Lysobacteraceae bacterium]
QLDGGTLAADVDLAPGGVNEIQLFPSRFTVPAQLAAPVLDVPALQLHGDIDIAIESATIGMALPKNVKGRAVWRDASVSGPAQAVFGDLEANFESPPAGGLMGRINDLGGPLMLDGEFHLDYRGYGASATLRARDDNPSVREALRYIGEPQADGSSRFELKGKLLPL